MAITGIHFLLTYKCNFACDHCFVYSCPDAKGVMKISDVREILSEAQKAGNVEWIFLKAVNLFYIIRLCFGVLGPLKSLVSSGV